MRRILGLACAAALSLCSVPAMADAPSTSTLRVKSSAGSYKLLDGVALNASAASRTVTVTLGADDARWSKLVLLVDLTWAAASTLDVAPTFSFDCSVYGAPQSVSTASGTGTASDYTLTKAVSADATPIFEVDVRTYRCAKFVISGTSGGASDLVDVYATAVVGY